MSSVEKKWCCMWLVVGFPKPLINLFHIGPVVHYHFGWDNPSCSLHSLYLPHPPLQPYTDSIDSMDLFINRSPFIQQGIPKWPHDTSTGLKKTKKKTFSPPQQCNNAPFLLLLFISTDHIGYFGRPVHRLHKWSSLRRVSKPKCSCV